MVGGILDFCSDILFHCRGRLGEEKEALMATVLMETKIRVKPNKECATEVARLLTFNEESMICGYEFSHDACQVG